jgi:hypothetical protein
MPVIEPPSAHAAPYREPRKDEACYRDNRDAAERNSHEPITKEGVSAPVLAIVGCVSCVCQWPSTVSRERGSLDVLRFIDDIELVLEMTVLLWADMRSWPHRLTAHRTARPSSGDHRGCFGAQVPRLLSRDAAGKGGIVFFWAIEVVSHDDKPVFTVIVAELHAADTKLFARLAVELGQSWGCRQDWTSVFQAFEHLLQCQSERKYLLFFHPDGVCLSIYDRQEPESSFPWFTYRFDRYALGVEIPNHIPRTTPYR